MANLVWFEINPPRPIDLETVTGVIRPLAARPGSLLRSIPLVVFELWGQGGSAISWRIGVAPEWHSDLTAVLGAHLPGSGVTHLKRPARPQLSLGAGIRTSGWASLLRTEMAGAVSAGLYAVLRQMKKHELAVVQWVIGPSRQRKSRPVDFGWTQAIGIRPVEEPDATAMQLWRHKTAEPIFAVTGRIGVKAKEPVRCKTLIRRLADALQLANSASAGIRLRTATPGTGRVLMTPARGPRRWSAVLNAAEVACLLGWPIEAPVSDDLPVIGGHIGRAPASLLVPMDDEGPKTERVIG